MQKLAPLLLACLLPTAAMATPLTDDLAPMPIAGPAHPPLGYVEMCSRHPDECAGDASGAAATVPGVRLSAQHWRAIFAASSGRSAEGPSVLTTSDPVQTVRIATPSRTWSLTSVDSEARPFFASQPRPFWWADEDTEVDEAPRLRPLNLTSESTALADSMPAPPQAPVAVGQPGEAADADLVQVRAVNARINRSLRRASDRETFGRRDFWATPADGVASGDCEDFVLAKRQALREAGVPAGAMSIALVRTRQGEMHAVLLVSTREGEVVLDNLSPWVLPWRQVPYTWLDRQAPNSGAWVRVAQAL